MSEPIKIDVVYTAEDYARGALFITRRKWWVRYFFVIAAIALWGVFGMAYLLSPESGKIALGRNLIVIFLATAIVLVFGFFNSRKTSNRALRRRFQKQIDSSPAMQEPKYVSIDGQGISSTQSLGSGDVSWAAVIEVVETSDDFFFFTAKDFAQFIPQHAFADDNERSRLRAILREQFGEQAKLLR